MVKHSRVHMETIRGPTQKIHRHFFSSNCISSWFFCIWDSGGQHTTRRMLMHASHCHCSNNHSQIEDDFVFDRKPAVFSSPAHESSRHCDIRDSWVSTYNSRISFLRLICRAALWPALDSIICSYSICKKELLPYTESIECRTTRPA